MTLEAKFKLHEFQADAVAAALGAIGRRKNELIVLPTGSGKSVVISGLVHRLNPGPNRRILIVSHVREIVDQDATALERHLPDERIGVICSSLGRHESTRNIVVASVQTLFRRPLGRGFDVCIVDEAHLIGRGEATMYQKLFANLAVAAKNRRRTVCIVGMTATPYRLDTGYLHVGKDALFERIAFDIPVIKLVQRGLLAPLTTLPVAGINFGQLRVRDREFVVSDYTKGDNVSWFNDTDRAIRQAAIVAADRKKWIVFCCTVKHAEAVAEMLAKSGLRTAVIHAKTKPSERDDVVKDFKSGKLRAIINVNVLTTGFDAPKVDCIVLLRPTASTSLYVQMIGRGMRRAPGKTDCLIVDFGGNIDRHGPLTEMIPMTMRPLENVEPVGVDRPCPDCGTKLPMFIKQCWGCGHLFATIEATPSALNVMVPIDAGSGKSVPPSAYEYLSTQAVAGMIGTTPNYVKQMRTLGSGPKFYNAARVTSVGYRQIIYRVEDVENWQSSLTIFPGRKEGSEGRSWRMRPKQAAE